jgi:hypothetical protein
MNKRLCVYFNIDMNIDNTRFFFYALYDSGKIGNHHIIVATFFSLFVL